MESSKTPTIRFTGFNDAWKMNKLNEICNYSSSSLSLNNSVENGCYPLYDANSLIGSVNSFFMCEDYITVIKDGAGVGRIRKLPKNSAFIGTMGALTSTCKELDFLFSLLEKIDLSKQFSGSTIPHIYFKDYGNYAIKTPTIPEQKQIGFFFSNLDNLITLHQRKFDKLQNVKKSMLEKMFPKNGSDVPETRFTGFTDAWEQRKFGDLVITRRGLTYKPTDVQSQGIRVLRSSNIDEDKFHLNQDDVFVEKKAINIDYVKNGDILITSANGSSRLVGKHSIITGITNESTVHGGFMIVATTDKPDFLNASMSSSWYKKFISLYVSGGNGAIGNLNKNDLDEQKVYIPTAKEQQQIGYFFSNLDSLITLHQRKLEKLQNMKKAMLEKMFI